MRLSSLLLSAALLGLAAVQPAVAQAPTTPPVAGKTAAGVSYTPPPAWTTSTQGPAIVLTAPENDLRIAVVDVGPAAGRADRGCESLGDGQARSNPRGGTSLASRG